MPIIVAPMSQQRMAYDEGELAVARAVAREDTAMVSVHSAVWIVEMTAWRGIALTTLPFVRHGFSAAQ